MQDRFAREIDYARLSITDHCNLRCQYCMPEEAPACLAAATILSTQEWLRLGKVLAELGIKKLKITGGEPLLRKDAVKLVAGLKNTSGIEKVTLTTNGVLLKRDADALAAAGLDGLNVSLDTLNPNHYHELTRWGNVSYVLDGLTAAYQAGLKNIKINCVALDCTSEAEIVELVSLAKEYPVHVRFIEMMPIGLGSHYKRVEQTVIQAVLEKHYGLLEPFSERLGNGPAVYYSLAGFKGKIGFISALGNCFCPSCNRIRVTADGQLKTCLHADQGSDLLAALRKEKDDNVLKETILCAIAKKPERHQFLAKEAGQKMESRIMSQIGG